MAALFIVLILGLVLVCLIMPWINYGKIRTLQKELAQLQRETAELRLRSGRFVVDTAEQVQKPETGTESPAAVDHEEHGFPGAGMTTAPAAEAPPSKEDSPGFDETAKKPSSISAEMGSADHTVERLEGLEQKFGGRAFVWLGGIALSLAGFFLVKYSIEAGLLSPTVRVTMGIIFGIGMLYAGNWVRIHPRFANGVRIAQALSGAGIAVLYASFYAATNLYNLIPPVAGFIGMAITTAASVMLSMWHGRPIALLGLMGGFLTPALVRSPHPSVSILFVYLFLLLAGLMVVIRYRAWWSMGIPAVACAFSWVPVWLYSEHYKPGDTLWLGLFLLAAGATVVILSREQYEKDYAGLADLSKVTSVLNYLAICGAIVLMGLAAFHGGFGPTEWILFGLLSAAGVALAHWNQKLYGVAPWTSSAVNLVILAAWQYGTAREFVFTLGIFAVLHVAGAYLLQLRSRNHLIWGLLTAAASLGYYLIAYFKIHSNPHFADIPLLWGSLALTLAIIGTCVLLYLLRHVPDDYPQKQHLLALYAGAVAAFLSIGLTIELKREFLSVAIAAEVLAVAWINTKVDIRALRRIGALLACVFAFLLIPQILLIIQLTAFSLVEAKLYLQRSIPIVNWPVFQLGLPSLCFMSAGYLLRTERDDTLVFALEAAAIALFGLMGYYFTRHLFHMDQNVLFVKAGFVERGVITNILFLYGIACLWAGNRYDRAAVLLGGLVLSGIALFRIGYFDLILSNPLWSGQNVGEWPIINGLLLPYALPIVWIWMVMKQSSLIREKGLYKYGYGFMFLLAFVLLSMEVRQLFHGARLDAFTAGSAEIYTYSAVWLVFGIGLLFLGTLHHNKMIRVASLPVILLTVAKVFLYDTSALTGLWRAFSFFCLGLCLIAISWFYTRFVFNSNRRG